MNTKELQKQVEGLRTSRIVTQQRGSWKWQDAFCVAEYRARLAENGKVVWSSYSRGWKKSKPQLGSRWWDYDHGSLHNRQVQRSDAVEGLGPRFVADLERRGWRFATGGSHG
jgi:hypothetical protein